MHRFRVSALLTVLALSLAPVLPARAAELEGQRFEDSVRVGERELLLNGLGLRSVFIVKGYVAGLYLPERARSAEQVLAQSAPRRLVMKLLIDSSAERFAKAFAEGLRDNHSEAQLAALREPAAQLEAAMLAIGSAKKGDAIALDFVEGATKLSLNGRPVGRPIAGEAMQAAILRVFLGERPVDRKLKAGLLGGAGA